MPGRKEVLATGEIYHIFNRGVASQPTFLKFSDFQRASNTFFFYRNKFVPVRYSKFIKLNLDRRMAILEQLNKTKDFIIQIIAFCLMPNHYHFLVRQETDNGISRFISKFTNSFTRYFNIKSKRKGTLFQGRFKAVRIITDEQLLHVSRYIHLNPYSSYIVKNMRDLFNYKFSSLPEYLGNTKIKFCYKDLVLGQFKNFKKYKEFVVNQADYQKSLEEIKHLRIDQN